MLVSRCSSVEVGTDQEVDAEEANASHPPYLTPAAASVTMASSISLLNKLVMIFVYVFRTQRIGPWSGMWLPFKESQMPQLNIFEEV